MYAFIIKFRIYSYGTLPLFHNDWIYESVDTNVVIVFAESAVNDIIFVVDVPVVVLTFVDVSLFKQ